MQVSGLGCHGHRHGSFFGVCLLLRFGYQLFPVATFFETSVNRADLGALLDGERRAALRAGLGDGHVWRRKIAIRVARATVENAWASPATLAGAAATNELAFIQLPAFAVHGDST